MSFAFHLPLNGTQLDGAAVSFFLVRGGIPNAGFACELLLLVKGFKGSSNIPAYFDIPVKKEE